MSDIRRKTEIVLANALKASLGAGWTIETSRGETDAGSPQPEATIKPPFVTVEAIDADNQVNDTWAVRIGIGYITALYDTLPEGHSQKFKQLYDAVAALRPGYDADQKYVMHGIDILSTEDFQDDNRQARGDVIMCAVGCSG